MGYEWNASDDMMAVKFNVYLENKKRKPRTGPSLSIDSINLLETTNLTKRICLGICNGILDFLGVTCPFWICFKLLMRELHDGNNKFLNYDDVIPEGLVSAWIDLIKEAVFSPSLCFPRRAKPPGAIGLPLLVWFADGAKPAFGACIYLQWRIPCLHGQKSCDLDFDARLLYAKARVTPLVGYTTARSELSGLVLLSRMSLTTVKALQTEESMKPRGVVMLADSECSISALQTSTRAMKPFFHNRVAEVLENIEKMEKYCSVEKVHHVAGDLNSADILTRGNASLTDIGPDSPWQRGPNFLRYGRALWPVYRNFVYVDLPDDELCKRPAFLYDLRASVMSSTANQFLPDLWVSIDKVCHYSNSLNKVLRILALVIRGWKLRSEGKPITAQNISDPIPHDMVVAEELLQLTAMPETASAFVDGKLSSLNPMKENSLFVTCGRIGEKPMSKLLGVPYLTILMPTSRAAFLYMVKAHEGEHGHTHCSIAETIARSRSKVWIVKASVKYYQA